MGNKDKKLARIWREIYEIFMNDWDPIGVNGVLEAKDEYDGYILGAYKLLMSGASEEKIRFYLSHIESDRMGLSGTGSNIEKAAKKLREIDIQ